MCAPGQRHVGYDGASEMEHTIITNPDGISIHVAGTAGSEAQLLAAFQECQAGRCTCPTQEYEKLAALEIVQSGDTIDLKLVARDGAQFDPAEIERCLIHTERRINAG